MFGGWLAGALGSKTLRGRRGAAAGAGEGRAGFGEGMWTVANWPVWSLPLYANVWDGTHGTNGTHGTRPLCWRLDFAEGERGGRGGGKANSRSILSCKRETGMPYWSCKVENQ